MIPRRRRSRAGTVRFGSPVISVALIGDEGVDGAGQVVDGGDQAGEFLAPHLRPILFQPEPPLLNLDQLAVALLPLLLAG